MGKKSNPVKKQRGKQRGGITGKGFMPGQSGNPAGRPKKGDAWADAIGEIMEQTIYELAGISGTQRKVRMEIIHRVALLAVESADHNLRLKAAQWLADRESGRPGQRVAFEDPSGNPLGPIILPVRECNAASIAAVADGD